MIQDLFYFAQLQSSMANSVIDLPSDEAKHLFVRRYNVGDSIQLFNGIMTSTEQEGLIADAIITQLNKQNASVTINHINITESPKIRLTIASALPKNDRIHTMLDMATQSGMTDFIPLSCLRSITKFKRNDKNSERLQKYVIESCKQCRRLNIPILHPIASVQDILTNKNENTLYLYADVMGDNLSTTIIHSLSKNTIDNVMVFIGPEGGFAPNEIALLTKHAMGIKLSDAILRTETATTLAAAMVNNWICTQ